MYHQELFKTLDDFIGESPRLIKDDKCCINPDIQKIDVMDTCLNCGNSKIHEETIIKVKFLNPKYQLSTSIGYGSNKYQPIRRIHLWTNTDYRENMAIKNYTEIKRICNDFNLSEKIKTSSEFKYKKIYIDNNISSRSKIKQSLFIYCIYESCLDYKVDFDIIKALVDNGLSIQNYNKAIFKIDDDKKIYLKADMMVKYHLSLKGKKVI